MLKRKFKVLFLLITIVTLLSTLSFATIEPRTTGEDNENGVMPISADETIPISEEGTPNLEEEEWINNDLFIMQDKYVLDKVVDGNAFIFANEVTINGEVGGNVFVFANKLTVNNGYINGSLFVAANEVVINGMIYDVYAACDNFTLEKDGFIGRDLKLTSNNFNLYGKVRRDVYVSAAHYNLPEASEPLVGGNFNYSNNSELTIPKEIVVGEIRYSKEIIPEESVFEKVSSYIFDAINVLVYTLVVIVLAILLAPKFVERVSNMDTKKAFISLGIGILVPIAVIIALFMLLISSVASMLSVAGILIFIAICMSGTAFASIYFGSIFVKLVKWEGKVKFVLASLITALVIWAISQIPYIGGIFGLLVALFGIGTLFVNAIYRKENTIQEVVETKTEE